MIQSVETQKRCAKCKQWKPFAQFNKDRTNASGYYSYCKDCTRAKPRVLLKPEPAIATCEFCGNDFTYQKYKYHAKRRFCSAKCIAQAKYPDAKTKSACLTCGKEIEWYKSWPRKYCSLQCAGKGNISNIPNWKPTAYEAICEQCQKPFMAEPASTRGRFCCFDCWRAWIKENAPTGEAHHLFKGGYKDHYYGPNWYNQRRKARKRDGYTCQHCGISEKKLGRRLDVHHLKPFRECSDYKEANRLGNLISLCASCHKSAEHHKIPIQPSLPIGD